MKFCPKNFIGNDDFYNNVLNILTLSSGSLSPLFSANNSKNIINDRYNEMKSEYCLQKVILEKPYSLLSLNPVDITSLDVNVGHDLPVWYSSCDESNDEETIICPEYDETEKCTFTEERLKGKRIMIIGLEPMRKNQNQDFITLSTPWGLHNRNFREGKKIKNIGTHLVNGYSKSSGNQAKWIYIFIKSLLRNGASVYLTDAYKLFFNNNVNSTSPAVLSSNQINLFRKIIDKEIELFSPNLIFALGKNNSKRLNDILSKHTEKIAVLNHINTHGWSNIDRCNYYKNYLINKLNELVE